MYNLVDEKQILNGFVSSSGFFVFLPSVVMLGYLSNMIHWLFILPVVWCVVVYYSYGMYRGLISFGRGGKRYVFSIFVLSFVDLNFLYLSKKFGGFYDIIVFFLLIYSIFFCVFSSKRVFNENKEFIESCMRR